MPAAIWPWHMQQTIDPENEKAKWNAFLMIWLLVLHFFFFFLHPIHHPIYYHKDLCRMKVSDRHVSCSHRAATRSITKMQSSAHALYTYAATQLAEWHFWFCQTKQKALSPPIPAAYAYAHIYIDPWGWGTLLLLLLSIVLVSASFSFFPSTSKVNQCFRQGITRSIWRGRGKWQGKLVYDAVLVTLWEGDGKQLYLYM